MLNQPFTWNPSGPGVKIEDTVLLTAGSSWLLLDLTLPPGGGIFHYLPLAIQALAIWGLVSAALGTSRMDVDEALALRVDRARILLKHPLPK